MNRTKQSWVDSLGGESSHGAVLVRGHEAFPRVLQFDDDQQVTDRYARERNHGVGEHREEAAKDLIAVRVRRVERLAMQRAARVEDEVERDGHDVDDHDRGQQWQTNPIEHVPAERVFDHHAPFDGDEKERRRRALPEVEKEDAEHLAERSRGFQVGHHGPEE